MNEAQARRGHLFPSPAVSQTRAFECHRRSTSRTLVSQKLFSLAKVFAISISPHVSPLPAPLTPVGPWLQPHTYVDPGPSNRFGVMSSSPGKGRHLAPRPGSPGECSALYSTYQRE